MYPDPLYVSFRVNKRERKRPFHHSGDGQKKGNRATQPVLFCAVCGAMHPSDASSCFACSQSLSYFASVPQSAAFTAFALSNAAIALQLAEPEHPGCRTVPSGYFLVQRYRIMEQVGAGDCVSKNHEKRQRGSPFLLGSREGVICTLR